MSLLVSSKLGVSDGRINVIVRDKCIYIRCDLDKGREPMSNENMQNNVDEKSVPGVVDIDVVV
jgi:hypothetical protein